MDWESDKWKNIRQSILRYSICFRFYVGDKTIDSFRSVMISLHSFQHFPV